MNLELYKEFDDIMKELSKKGKEFLNLKNDMSALTDRIQKIQNILLDTCKID